MHCARPTCDNMAYRGKYQGYCRKHAEALGIKKKAVSTEETRQILDYVDERVGLWEACRQTGTKWERVWAFRNNRNKSLRRKTLDKLLTAVPNTEPHIVDAWPYARRLQALLALGYTAKELQEESETTGKLDRMLIGAIALQPEKKPRIYNETAQKVAALYERLEATPMKRTPVWEIARKRFPTPLMWDDIDDPDEKPEMPKVRRRGRTFNVSQLQHTKFMELVEVYGGTNRAAKAMKLAPSVVDSLVSREGRVRQDVLNTIHRHWVKHFKPTEQAA